MITIDDFKKLDLRVGRIVSADRIPNADKLVRLSVDVGDGTRTLVAGIAPFYAPEELVGQEIVVVANLQPARIRGIESQGMLLAAQDGSTGAVVLLCPRSPVTPGSKVS